MSGGDSGWGEALFGPGFWHAAPMPKEDLPVSGKFWHGDKIIARFTPKNLETLRPCMVELIGRTFEWEWVGTSDDDEPYPNQSRWIMSRKHDAEIPDECVGRWAPFEDLQPADDLGPMRRRKTP